MNTTQGNKKAKMKVDYEDIFENDDKSKDTEKDEKDTKMNIAVEIQNPRRKLNLRTHLKSLLDWPCCVEVP